MLAKRFYKIALAGCLLLGMKAWGVDVPAGDATNNDHVLSDLAKEFRDGTLKEFEKGLTDPKLRENFSIEATLLRRSLLLLQATAKPEAEMTSLKDFPDVEKALHNFMAKDPELRKLLEKKKLTLADFAKVEKALLVSKEPDKRDLMAKLAVLIDVETEKTLNSGPKAKEMTTEEVLNKLALRKLVSLPPEIRVGERTPFLKEINEKLKAIMREADPDSKAEPTLKDLALAIKSGKLTLKPGELLELNKTLAPVQVQENGGFATNEMLRQLYRAFASQLPPARKGNLGSVEKFFDSFAKLPNDRPIVSPPGTAPLRKLAPFTSRAGSLVTPEPTDRAAQLPSVPEDKSLFEGEPLSSEEKQCLNSAGLTNYELQLNFASKPGSTSFCSSTPVSLNPEQSRVEPTKSTEPGTEGQCEADFLTAKHCVEPGDLESLAINGVSEPISHAQVLVANHRPSVTGGDDIALIRAVMPCPAAKSLRYQALASDSEARSALGANAGLIIARNREINVGRGEKSFVYARGYVADSSGEFSGFALTKDNAGKKVKKGDSGGPQLACIKGHTPKVIGATSTILVTDKGDSGGNLGRAASMGSLNWALDTLGGKDVSTSPPERALTQRSTTSLQKNGGADKAAHPTTL